MKAIIVDEELASAELLKKTIETSVPEVAVAALCVTESDAVENLKALKPDILLLALNKPNLAELKVLEQVNTDRFALIVTSPSDKHAFVALKQGAVDYLLKPVKPAELREAVRKVVARRNDGSNGQLEMLMNYYKPQPQKVRRIALTASDHLVFVETNEILYCESDSNYTTFFLNKGDKVVVSKTLKDVEELLHRDDFFRIHASYLVNMKHVTKFTRGDTGQVVMSNQQHLPVSRKKKDEFFEKFSRI